DFNNYEVRRVNDDDTIETLVGATDPAFPGDGPFTGITPEGAPGTDWLHNHKLLTIDPGDGYTKVFCGGGAGFAGDGMPAGPGTLFKQPVDITSDESGNIYVVDQQNGRVRMIAA